MPIFDSNNSKLLNPVVRFLSKYSGTPYGRALADAAEPAARFKRRQEYGLNSPMEQAPATVNQPASKPISSSKPSSPKPTREKVTTVNAGIQQRGIGGKIDFKSKGAISTAAGGNTDYSLGYTPGLIKYKGTDAKTSTSDFGLKADTSGLKADKPMAAEPTRKQMRQARRIERLERRQEIQKQKGELALSEGRTMDAKQKRYRYDNLQKRIDRLKSKM